MAEISGVPTADIDNVDGFFTTQGGGGGTATLPTPTISVSGGTFGAISIEVTNHASYTNPNYKCVADIGATNVVADSSVIRVLDSSANHIGSSLTFNDINTSSAQRTVTVKAQEFGANIESAGVTATYNISGIQNTFIRLRIVTATGADTNQWGGINELAFYESISGTGVKHPAVPMTSDTLPLSNNLEVLTGHVYSTSYPAWYAMDGNINSQTWWPLSTTANNYYQVEFTGTVPAIASMTYRRGGNDQTGYFRILGSNTGAFAGEETDYGVFGPHAINYTYTIG
tara:strand:- start:963 stop:1817 length:855 start_codon:yes stop_codon:yes gene_type:complete